jgi:hypothetical protein
MLSVGMGKGHEADSTDGENQPRKPSYENY